MMSAAQTTPRPATLTLSLDKSLPPAPVEDDDEQGQDGRPAIIGQLPERPPFQRHWTSAAPEGASAAAASAASQSFPGVLDLPSDLSDNDNTVTLVSSAARVARTPTVKAAAADGLSRSMSIYRMVDSLDLSANASKDYTTSRDSFVSASANTPDAYVSPVMQSSASPHIGRRSDAQTTRSRRGSSSVGGDSGSAVLDHSRPPSQLRTRNLSMHGVAASPYDLGPACENPSPSSAGSNTHTHPLERASGYFPHLPDPASFPLPSSSRMGSMAADLSSASAAAGANLNRISRGHSHYSSDMSARNSTSTRGSLWTERSQTSCDSSPGGIHSSIGFERFPKAPSSSAEEPPEATEEIDEQSVGLGITSNDEADGAASSSRRSHASPIVPSSFMVEGSPALSGPFSHHRVPSWTRKTDLGGLAMLSLSGSAAALDASRPTVVRTTSEMSPHELQRSRLENLRAVPPHVPFRSQSRQRCLSEASHVLPRGHAKNSSSVSSIYSSHSSSSSHFHSALPASSDSHHGAALTRTLSSSTCSSTLSISRSTRANPQSPPRSSSLRPSESTGSSQPLHQDSLRRSASIRRKAFMPTQPDLSALRRPSTSLSIVAADEHRLEPAAEVTDRAPSQEAAASRGRKGSDASLSSFLQAAEFSHVLGAYADRFRWDEDGLYGFDESAETEDEDSQAVKTARDGSAAIVHANGRQIAEVEGEAGPNTTHLVLRGCSQPGVFEMLERVLPSTQRLLVLDVSGCGLSRLPESLGNCLSLEELDVSRNRIGALPECVSNLRALRVFSANNTGVRALPSSLSNLQDLQCLGLQNNSLTHLPRWLHRLSKLDRLMLEGNMFKGPWAEAVSPLVTPPRGKAAAPLTPSEHASLPSSGVLPPVGAGAAASAAAVTSVLPNTATRPSTTRRLKSTGDFNRPQWPSDTSTPTSPEEDLLRPFSTVSHTSGGQIPVSASATNVSDGLAQFGALADASPPASRSDSRRGSEVAHEDVQSGPGKWGFLKKIGRKASSSRLGVMYNDHVGAAESRTTSPKPTRAVLRNSGGAATRPRSRSGSASAFGFVRDAMSSSATPPPPLPLTSSRMDTLAESGAAAVPMINGQVPATSFALTFPPSSQGAHATSSASTLSPTSKQAKRRSFLPMLGFQLAAAAASSDAASAEIIEELSAEALAQHKQSVRVLMHYLRDLDDLTTVRSLPGQNGSPLMREQQIAAAAVADSPGDEGGAPLVAMTRNSSIASGDSSAPSSLLKSSASMASSAVSTPMTEERMKRSPIEEPARGSSIRDDSVRRTRIVEEIVRTEETYVKGLNELVDIYVKPAQLPADGHGTVPIVPQTEQRMVFGNVEAIMRFHAEVFLPALRSAARPLLEGKIDLAADDSWDFTASVAESVANVFTQHAAFFKMYMSYINNCDSAQTRINVWMAPSSVINAAASFKSASLGASQHGGHSSGNGHGPGQMLAGTPLGYDFGLAPAQRKKIKHFMKRCRLHPSHSQLNVESYLLLPVQRIPRYRLLIEDLVRSTDPARLRSADALSNALEHVSQIASNVNESKRQSEQDRRLLGWQYRIRGTLEAPLVQPHRRLVKDGPLRLRKYVKRMPGFIRQTVSTEVAAVDPSTAVPTEATQVLQVDHLAQTIENRALTVLLCNDVVVLINDPSFGRDTVSPVNLYDILRLERPVDIVGSVGLRLVGRKTILYLTAASPEEAIVWKRTINAQLQP